MAFSVPFLNNLTGGGPDKKANANKPINQFVSQVKTGALARSNRFAVMFTPMGISDYSALQKVLLFCEQVQLPGANFSTVQNRSFGEFREVPYEKLYDQITMTFYVDKDMQVKYLFDQWQQAIQDPVTRTFNYYDSYTTNMVIEVQDINDNTRYQMTLYECYPKSISSVQMDHSNKDVMRIQVGIQYKYWESTTVSTIDGDGNKIGNGLIDKFTQNFNKFQSGLNSVLGDRLGNAVTGGAMTYGVTKIPGLLGSLRK
jgi:hypothetical protein